MSLSTLLDLAIGLVFSFLVLSLIASSLQEIAASMFRQRAKQLERSLATSHGWSKTVGGRGGRC